VIALGETLEGRYRIASRLGEGGMGVVYRATHLELGVEVAVKVLREEALGDQEAVTRFYREARAASALKGSHVARVLDVGRLASGSPYLVMEFLEGNDLDAELERRGALPVGEAVRFVLEACDAMSEAHALGIVHRDLKPANLFLARAANGRTSVKVLDFGISKLVDPQDQRVTQTQAVFGTPLYMAPESLRSTKHADARADVWALGVILYELLAGRPPFLGESASAVTVAITVDPPAPLRAVRPEVPAELEAVILRALEKKPEMRFPTVDELARALEPFAEVLTRTGQLAPSARNSLTGTERLSLPVSTEDAIARTLRIDASAAKIAPNEPNASQGARRGVTIVLAGAAIAAAAVVGVVALVRSSVDGAEDRPSANAVSSVDAPAPRATVEPVVAPPASSPPIPSAPAGSPSGVTTFSPSAPAAAASAPAIAGTPTTRPTAATSTPPASTAPIAPTFAPRPTPPPTSPGTSPKGTVKLL
jgi:serine/threonine protein kinase